PGCALAFDAALAQSEGNARLVLGLDKPLIAFIERATNSGFKPWPIRRTTHLTSPLQRSESPAPVYRLLIRMKRSTQPSPPRPAAKRTIPGDETFPSGGSGIRRWKPS